ncbi:TetR/AcrR family transcriptional regulator [Sporosarcina newyorkensis]|uniref:TetR/AcrR family transcriptional regulator n=1 Tax=Sporosarcina newyorkensis TaxID=759851 RepID=UPI003D0535F7
MDRRQEIMLAAEKSFTLFGYKATTMDQVAKIANVGKGTIYTFFSNKEELFHSIVWRMVKEMRDMAEEWIVEGASFEENAHAIIMQLLKFRETHQLYIKLIEEEKELRTPAVGEVLASIEQEILRFIQEKIERSIAKGELKPCNSKLVSYLLLKSYIALVVDWDRTHDEELPEEEITQLLSTTIFSSLAYKQI